MEKAKSIKWQDRPLYEKISIILVIIFALAGLTMIILDTIYRKTLYSKLANIFIYLELISVGIANYKINKKLFTFLIIIESILLILTLV